jgi:hypothetical protein
MAISATASPINAAFDITSGILPKEFMMVLPISRRVE